MEKLNNNLTNNNKAINPFFVTGFCDAESAFQITIYKNDK